MPIRNTRIGERAVPPRKATTNAYVIGRVPIAGSTVYLMAYQNAATPPQIEPRKNTMTYTRSASMPIVLARSGLIRVALI